jgi:hypothetical protein
MHRREWLDGDPERPAGRCRARRMRGDTGPMCGARRPTATPVGPAIRRRRDGHDDPALPLDGSRLPRRALRGLAARPEGQQRPAGADAAGRHRRHPPRSISRPAPTSSRPTPSTRRASRRPTTAWSRCPRAERGGGGSRASSRRVGPPAGKPRFVAGALGPTNRTASHLAGRERPGFRNVTSTNWSPLREASDGLIEGGATCC